MSARNYYNPLFIGFDRLFQELTEPQTFGSKYPPYNIVKLDDQNYQIKMALAGYNEADLDISVENCKLTIKGVSKEDHTTYLHRGIANRSFTRDFTLADTIEVTGAEYSHGMLVVNLKNVIPESQKPKKIEIKSGDKQLLVE